MTSVQSGEIIYADKENDEILECVPDTGGIHRHAAKRQLLLARI